MGQQNGASTRMVHWPFSSQCSFLIPLKTKPLVFWCFQGDQKETLGRKGLRIVRKSFIQRCYFLKIPHIFDSTFFFSLYIVSLNIFIYQLRFLRGVFWILSNISDEVLLLKYCLIRFHLFVWQGCRYTSHVLLYMTSFFSLIWYICLKPESWVSKITLKLGNCRT